MCELFEMSRSGYYRHLAPKSEVALAKEAADEALVEKITTIFEKKKKRYGSPRIHAELKKQKVPCSLGRVKRLMRQEGLYAVSGKKHKRRCEPSGIAETRNLLLEHSIRPTEVNQVWHTDTCALWVSP